MARILAARLALLLLGATAANAECHRRHSIDAVLLDAPRAAALALLPTTAPDAAAPAGVVSAPRRRAQADHDACNKDLTALAHQPGAHPYVRVFMMSHCPYAGRALQLLLPTLINQQSHGAAPQLKLEFIGTGSDERSFRSLHGPTEVVGDRLYLCLQDLTDQPSFMRAAFCLSRQPSRVGEQQQAEGCFGLSGISEAKMKEIFDCADQGETASLPMLRDSFAKSMRLKIGESPTIFFGLEGGNATDAATRARLEALHVSPGAELLYCGDHSHPHTAPQGFVQATCDAVATMRRGAALGSNMHVNLAECPMDAPNADPECVDSSVDGGAVGGFPAFGFMIFFLGMFTCCSICQPALSRTNRRGRQQLLDGGDAAAGGRGGGGGGGRNGRRAASESAGLSAEALAALPRVRVEDSRGTTCTICFEVVDDGEEIFALSCGHRHHQSCLNDWLQRKSDCPDCRGRVRPADLTTAGATSTAGQSRQACETRGGSGGGGGGGTTTTAPAAAAAAALSPELAQAPAMDQLLALQAAQSSLAQPQPRPSADAVAAAAAAEAVAALNLNATGRWSTAQGAAGDPMQPQADFVVDVVDEVENPMASAASVAAASGGAQLQQQQQQPPQPQQGHDMAVEDDPDAGVVTAL